MYLYKNFLASEIGVVIIAFLKFHFYGKYVLLYKSDRWKGGGVIKTVYLHLKFT